MNTIQIFIDQGELIARRARRLYQRIILAHDHSWYAPPYFIEAVNLFNRIRNFLKYERVLFIRALVRSGENPDNIERINKYAQTLDELLNDLMMLHVDEPDGSFITGLLDVINEFENTLKAMGDSLASMPQDSALVDLRPLQDLLQGVA